LDLSKDALEFPVWRHREVYRQISDFHVLESDRSLPQIANRASQIHINVNALDEKPHDAAWICSRLGYVHV